MTGRATTTRWSGEEGLAGGAEALVFGVLIFVIGTLLFTSTWAVVDAKFATAAAAREAVRAAAETPPGENAEERATDAARGAIDAHGLDPEDLEVEATGTWTGGLERCQEVEVVVTYRVPVIALPGVNRAIAGFDVVGRHREVVDPFRTGLAIGGACDF